MLYTLEKMGFYKLYIKTTSKTAHNSRFAKAGVKPSIIVN